jgi:hypothetical protein
MRFRACLALLALAAPASAQCTPDWSDKFSHPDFDRPAYSTIVFDDGTGPALYAGGNFQEAWQHPRIPGRKVGWLALASPSEPSATPQPTAAMSRCSRPTMMMAPARTRPTLYASGNVTSAFPGDGIVRWDGLSWVPIPNFSLRERHGQHR